MIEIQKKSTIGFVKINAKILVKTAIHTISRISAYSFYLSV